MGLAIKMWGFRVPSIKAAKELLKWSPKTDLESALRQTLDYHLGEKAAA